jgi:integrase
VEAATGLSLSFPFSLKSTLAYTGYLLGSKEQGGRGLAGDTVERYLSAVRMLHLRKGFFSPWVRPDIVKQITKGAANRDQIEKRMAGKAGKHAMTPDLMRSLKQSLFDANLNLSKKRIIWAVSTVCWAGALRIHEILARAPDCFDPLTTMLAADIVVAQARVEGKWVDALKVHLKHPKEERLSAGVTIDVFASNDFMCPVKAFKDWMRDKVVKPSAQKPLFRLADGTNYTGASFNKDLKALLKGVVDYDTCPITAHSFRRGLATFMAKHGYKDDDIMKVGRWHSEAFKRYIATPREVRAKLASELAAKVASSMKLS